MSILQRSFVAVALIALTPAVFADPRCALTLAEGVRRVFVEGHRRLDLHDEHLEHGDFSCGQVCAINVIGALRLTQGLEGVDALNIVNALNREFPDYRGGLDATQFNQVVTSWLARFGPGRVEFRYDTLEYTSRPTATGPFAVERFVERDLRSNARTARIVTYAAFDAAGVPIGAHTVAVVGREKNVLIISDPNVPERTLRMKLGQVSWFDEAITLRLVPEEPEFVNPRYGTQPLIVIGIATFRRGAAHYKKETGTPSSPPSSESR